MRLILVRHADAEHAAVSDFERRLTDKGRKQSARLGAFLSRIGIAPERICASPLVRAQETADLLRETMGLGCTVEEDKRLACGMTAEEGCEVLREFDGDGDFVMVGHEPDCSRFLAALTGMAGASNVDFKKGAFAVVDVGSPRPGDGVLLAFLPPKFLP